MSPEFSLKLRRKRQIVKDERLDRRGKMYAGRTLLWGKVNLFTAAMSGEIGEEGNGGGERLQVRFHQRTRQTNNTKNTKWSEKWGFKAPRFDFQKGIALTYCRLKDISLNKTHGKAVGPLVKPITATVVIQLPYTVMIMIIKHKPESHIAISGNMLGLKNRIHMQIKHMRGT